MPFPETQLVKGLFVECLYLLSNLPSDLQTYLLTDLQTLPVSTTFYGR